MRGAVLPSRVFHRRLSFLHATAMLWAPAFVRIAIHSGVFRGVFLLVLPRQSLPHTKFLKLCQFFLVLELRSTGLFVSCTN